MITEKQKAYNHKYYLEHKEKYAYVPGRQKSQKRKERIKEYNKEYYQKHKEWAQDYSKQWQREHPIETRANVLVQGYKKTDRKMNRGECTLTTQWILENIFNSKCVYCGAVGWEILGCDRIDNNKPHTPDNVVCSCYGCNKKRGSKRYEIFKMLQTPQYITISCLQ